jgi:hypothetical protein
VNGRIHHTAGSCPVSALPGTGSPEHVDPDHSTQCTYRGENAVASGQYSEYSCAPFYNQWGNTELYQLWVA